MMTKQEIRKKVFMRAHRYAKRMEGDYKACFVYALKMQWACFKEALKEPEQLEGSPKQIAWAEDMRKEKILAPLWEDFVTTSSEITEQEDTFRDLKKKQEFIRLMRTQKSAKWWISTRFDNVVNIARSIIFTNREKDEEKRIYSFGKYYNPDCFRLIDGQFVQCDMWGKVIKKRA